jgi:hypothetical protein
MSARHWTWFAAACLGLFGVVALAHTALGRPLLGLLRGAPGCPVSLDAVDPAKLEAFRSRQLREHRGVLAPAGHPALHFELGTTRRADVLSWQARTHASCRSLHKDTVLRCAGVPAAALDQPGASTIDNLHLQFDQEQRLVAVDLFRAPGDSRSALHWLDTLDRDLTTRVGRATTTLGEWSPSFLEQHALQRVAREYRYLDYVAEVSALHLGDSKVRVREQYQWLAPL